MKELFRKALLFLLVFLGVYLMVFWVLCQVQVGGTPFIYRTSDYLNWKGGNSYRKFQEFRKDSLYDVVFIGSSHAYRGYDPVLFTQRGHSSFNLGTSAQSPLNSYYILKNYLDSGNTRLIILDTYEAAMEMDGIESTADLTQNISSDAAAVGMALALRDPRGLNMLTLRMMRRDAPPMYADEGYRPGGSALRPDSVKGDIHYVVGRPLALEERQVRYMRAFFRHCQEQHIPLVLVNHYYPKASDRAKHAVFNAFLQKEADAFGLRYFDLAYDHELDDRDHFYDHNHLNKAGVEIFNARLIDLLEREGILRLDGRGRVR